MSRVAGGWPLPVLMAARILEPLGMTETGFAFPAGTDDRRTCYYRHGGDGLVELDGPAGQWSTVPAFPSGAGGLVSTLADVLAFQRMLLAGGGDILPAELVTAMATDQLTPMIRASDTVFLDGQSWGFGGGVDIERANSWNVPGRFGWVGTSAYVVPSDDSAAILLTQVELARPTGSTVIERFWAAAADAPRPRRRQPPIALEPWPSLLRIQCEGGQPRRRYVLVAVSDEHERDEDDDPSFFNWPALPVALADTIVPDFPLASKSFNLSYAGNDL